MKTHYKVIIFITTILIFGVVMSISISSLTIPKSKYQALEQELHILKARVAERQAQWIEMKEELKYLRNINQNPLIDPAVLKTIILIESSNDPDAYNEKEGAVGLMQLRPVVYKEICGLTQKEAFEPTRNIACGSLYLKHLLDRFHGNLERTLHFYNNGWRGNPEYIEKFMKHMKCEDKKCHTH